MTDADDLDGCDVGDGPTTDDDELPYVVLFASALAYPEGQRAGPVEALARAYRTLFAR